MVDHLVARLGGGLGCHRVRDDVDPAISHASIIPLRAYYHRAVSRGEVEADPTLWIEKPAEWARP